MTIAPASQGVIATVSARPTAQKGKDACPGRSLPMERLRRTIANMAGAENCSFVDAARLASALLGNTIGANIFLLGFAY